MLDLHSVVTGTWALISIRATVKKQSKRVILEHFHVLATQLLNHKNLGLPGDNQLWHVTSEHSKGKQSAKEKAAFPFKYLFVLVVQWYDLCLSLL